MSRGIYPAKGQHFRGAGLCHVSKHSLIVWEGFYANPLLLQYANTRIEELDAEQLRLIADLTANSVSASQIDSITDYFDDWESVSFDDKRKVADILISQIDATSESVTIHWKI